MLKHTSSHINTNIKLTIEYKIDKYNGIIFVSSNKVSKYMITKYQKVKKYHTNADPWRKYVKVQIKQKGTSER